VKGDLLISYKVETLDPQGQWLLIKHENTSESKWILQEESANGLYRFDRTGSRTW
jgi:hypothetical protein